MKDQKRLVNKRSPVAREKPSRTRTALHEALLSLLAERPFEQILVKEITARASVGYATFFRRYPDKDALLHDLAASEIRKLLAMTLPVFYTVDSQASTRALCAYVWDQRKLWKALLTGGAAATLKEEYLRQALRVVQETPIPNPWLPEDLAVTFSVTAIVEMLAWWLKQAEPLSVKEMADILNRLAIEAVVPRAGETRPPKEAAPAPNPARGRGRSQPG